MPTLKQLQVPYKIVLGFQSDATPTGGNNSMAVDGYFFTKEHGCMDGSGTPFYAYDKATNQDMYVIHNVMSERLEKSQCN